MFEDMGPGLLPRTIVVVALQWLSLIVFAEPEHIRSLASTSERVADHFSVGVDECRVPHPNE